MDFAMDGANPSCPGVAAGILFNDVKAKIHTLIPIINSLKDKADASILNTMYMEITR